MGAFGGFGFAAWARAPAERRRHPPRGGMASGLAAAEARSSAGCDTSLSSPSSCREPRRELFNESQISPLSAAAGRDGVGGGEGWGDVCVCLCVGGGVGWYVCVCGCVCVWGGWGG